MSVDIDFSEFRGLNSFIDKQPLYPFVEVTIGGVRVSDFDDEVGDTVMDFSYRRTAHQDVTDVSGDSFTLTLYDDTAIEIESLIYNVILKTTHQAEEQVDISSDTVVDENSTNNQENGSINTEDINNTEQNNGEGSSDSGTEGDSEGEKSDEDLWVEALEQINNIDISYGWVDMSGNKFLEKSVNGNYSKYSMEFEGASAILTIEGKSVSSGDLNSPSNSAHIEYPAKEFGGVASDIVKSIIDATPTLKYTSTSIEETEPILGEDGKPKSFIRNGETPEEFIKKYLCEEAKSKKSGKVGYMFYIDSGIAYFLPNETPKDLSIEVTTKSNKVSKSKKNINASSIRPMEGQDYDDSSTGIVVENGTEYSDDLDDYDELDEYDDYDLYKDEYLDEDDLSENISDITGLSDFNIDEMEEVDEEALKVMDTEMSDFESDYYLDMEYDDDTDSIRDADVYNNTESTEEEPEWLRKFGIKLEL